MLYNNKQHISNLLEQILPCLAMVHEYIEDMGGCDHSVGICYCEDRRRLNVAVQAIEQAKLLVNSEEELRMCLTCGKYGPPGTKPGDSMPECQDPEEQMAACTFDATAEEARGHWMRKFYILRAAVQQEAKYCHDFADHYAQSDPERSERHRERGDRLLALLKDA